MTLLFRRRAIEASVAGSLDADEDAALRAHLSTCEACRAHYDTLVVSTRALTDDADATGLELTKERARLERALSGQKPTPRASRRWLLVPASALAVLLAVVVAQREPDVVERGGGDDVRAPFSVSLYARAKSGATPVRLAAQFPESGEAVVSSDDWLQVKAPADVVVVLVSEKAPPRRLETSSSESLPPGTVRVFAVRAPVDEVLRAAQGATPSVRRLPLASAQVTGVLTIRP
ncbi:MAG: zf-HC2 domain-containing protein [Myxococcaceae bacterium]|nr:zf-HC2 domain-containing protein [Myxococcaceae bacterium]